MPTDGAETTTLLTKVRRRARQLEGELDYLEKHSSITTDGGWASLVENGLAGQRLAWDAFEHLRSFGAFLLGRDVPYRKQVFLEHAEVVALAIAQEDRRVEGLTNHLGCFAEARASLDQMIQLLDELPKHQHDMRVIVPDTNILLRLVEDGASPDLDEMRWAPLLMGWWHVLVAIAPQVVKELDRLKFAQHGKLVGRRAQGVIRTLNKIWRTDRAMLAIPVEEKVQAEFLLTEPPATEAALFSWLDPSIADHRVLLSTLDAARRWPHDAVVLATNDLHLALLAGYAGVATVSLDNFEDGRP